MSLNYRLYIRKQAIKHLKLLIVSYNKEKLVILLCWTCDGLSTKIMKKYIFDKLLCQMICFTITIILKSKLHVNKLHLCMFTITQSKWWRYRSGYNAPVDLSMYIFHTFQLTKSPSCLLAANHKKIMI